MQQCVTGPSSVEGDGPSVCCFAHLAVDRRSRLIPRQIKPVSAFNACQTLPHVSRADHAVSPTRTRSQKPQDWGSLQAKFFPRSADFITVTIVPPLARLFTTITGFMYSISIQCYKSPILKQYLLKVLRGSRLKKRER